MFKAIQTYSDGSVVSWIQVPTKALPGGAGPTAPGAHDHFDCSEPWRRHDGHPGRSGIGRSLDQRHQRVKGTGINATAIAALVLAAFAVLVALLAVWLGRPRFGAPGAGEATEG